MSVAEKVKSRRIALDMSQRDLANKIGCTHTTIARIESGKIDTSQSRIVQLAKALYTTPAYLMGWEDEEKNSPSADELSPKKQALMQFVQAVPEDKAEMILQVMKTILQVD